MVKKSCLAGGISQEVFTTLFLQAVWISQQARDFLMDAEDLQLISPIVMPDKDGKYPAGFNEVDRTSDVEVKRNTPRPPNLRAHVERFIQTLKQECLDKLVIVAEWHLNYVCQEWRLHCNRERPHSATNHLPPDFEPRTVRTAENRPTDIVCTTRLGGLLRSYERRVA